MSSVRRQYPKEFKVNAVQLSHTSSKSIAEIARHLGISEGVLYRWRGKYLPNGNPTARASQEEELKVLRAENSELRMENDMLKKAAAYFARNQR
jgi:transposase